MGKVEGPTFTIVRRIASILLLRRFSSQSAELVREIHANITVLSTLIVFMHVISRQLEYSSLPRTLESYSSVGTGSCHSSRCSHTPPAHPCARSKITEFTGQVVASRFLTATMTSMLTVVVVVVVVA